LSAPLAISINGSAIDIGGPAVSAMDRGLNYGDGVFETALVHEGSIRFLDAHLARLYLGCERLRIAPPGQEELLTDIARLVGDTHSAVLKIVITRGETGRGYRPDPHGACTRILTLHPPPASVAGSGLRVRWCEMRLSRNERLAGIKHLNRLEQVLAQAEWQPDVADEGLMLDTAGEVVCATSANVFVVRQGVLTTPDLRFCGVHGVMRAQVLRAAEKLSLPVSVEPLWPEDLAQASEVFITNAVRGIRSVAALDELRWDASPVAEKLRDTLRL
jgi:4-amino-4-deoxychorismate lyase